MIMKRELFSGGAPWLIALRILEGVGEGTTFPALNTLLAAWIPLTGKNSPLIEITVNKFLNSFVERSKASALVFGGAQVSYYLLIIELEIVRFFKISYKTSER